MKPIIREIKSFSGGLLSLLIALIALMWVLQFVGKRGWGPLSTIAVKAQGLATGNGSGVVAGPVIPAATNIQSNYHAGF